MLFGPLFMIFVIAAIVVGVVLLVRWLGSLAREPVRQGHHARLRSISSRSASRAAKSTRTMTRSGTACSKSRRDFEKGVAG
jgi:hypothetical protein